MRKHLKLLTVAFLLTLSSAAACFGQDEITVAAWNVQGVEFNNAGVPQPVSKADRLAEAIAAIKPDIIALSEVSSRDELLRVVASLKQRGLSYRFTIPAQPLAQKIAMLFRKGDDIDVQIGARQFIPGSDAGQTGRLRKALATTIKVGGFDFLFIAVHMKSGRSNAERKTRTTQATAIRTFIRKRVQATGEQDVLVVGDYNMIPSQDAVNFTAMSQGFLRFVSSDLTPPSHIGSCPGGTPAGNLLDGFAIGDAGTNEYVSDSAQILQLHTLLGLSCDNYKRQVSDHFPLTARFKVSGTDDD